jgi:prepilin-type N-terminal cleavage/methylation domain-containing protein
MQTFSVGRASKSGGQGPGVRGQGKKTASPLSPAPGPRPLAPARGVTLVEMMIVVAIVGLMVGITFPAVSAGLDSVRLASATDSLASFLNAAVNRAERRQQPMELIISPKDNLLTLYSNEPGFTRELRLPEGIAIEAVLPRNPDDPQGARRLILMPGATVPGIGIQVANQRGAHRIVRLDPMTGFPRVESVDKE